MSDLFYSGSPGLCGMRLWRGKKTVQERDDLSRHTVSYMATDERTHGVRPGKGKMTLIICLLVIAPRKCYLHKAHIPPETVFVLNTQCKENCTNKMKLTCPTQMCPTRTIFHLLVLGFALDSRSPRGSCWVRKGKGSRSSGI